MIEKPVVIVTGASRGLGAASARAAAELGAAVTLSARSTSELEAEARHIQEKGGAALVVTADLSREEDCRAIIEATLERFGRIDALVNNGGVIEPIAPVAEGSLEEWEQLWRVNVLGAVRLIQLALPHLRPRRGRVINITSGSVGNAIGGWAAYSSSKAALNQITLALSSEEEAVTAIALRPGIVDTGMQTHIRQVGKGRMAENAYHRLYGLYETGRLLPPETPAKAIAVLALHAPHAWSGQALQWDDEPVQTLVRQYYPE